MNTFVDSFISLLNGLFVMTNAAKNPLFIVGVLLIISFSWLALLEIDELNRQGSKPEVGRH